MSNVKRYEFQLIDDTYVLIQGVDVDTLVKILAGVQAAKNYADTAGKSGKSYVEHVGEMRSSEYAVQATWYFDNLEAYYKSILNVPVTKRSGSCVYFLEHPMYPTLIKIGHTNSLNRRSQELAAANIGLPVKVVAFAQLAQRQDFEASLHLMFAGVRVVGEWFRRERVVSFLSYCRAIRKD